MRVQAVAFDLEGTILNTDPIHHEVWLKVAREKLGIHLTLEQAIQKIPRFIGGGDPRIAQELAAISGEEATQILKAKTAYYLAQLARAAIQPREGFGEFLKTLQSRGIPFSIGSLTPNEQAIYLIKTAGLDSYFPRQLLVLRDDVKTVKPAPDVYLETARRLGVTPEHQLVFEDSATGVEAAVAAGSPVIGMPTYFDLTVGVLRKVGAVMVCQTWREVPAIQKLLNGVF